MADEKEKEPEAPKTKVSVYLNGEEVYTQDVENATGVQVLGSTGGASFPVSPATALPVGVYILTTQNPTPVRPETKEEKEEREKAAKAEKEWRDSVTGKEYPENKAPEPVPAGSAKK